MLKKIKQKLNSKKGLLGVTLSLFYIGLMLNLIASVDLISRVTIAATGQFADNARAYYAARAGLELGMASIAENVSAPEIPTSWEIGKVYGNRELSFTLEAIKATSSTPAGEAANKGLISLANGKYFGMDNCVVYQLNSTGKVTMSGSQKATKTIQCAYVVANVSSDTTSDSTSIVSGVIGWRELFGNDSIGHKTLGNREKSASY